MTTTATSTMRTLALATCALLLASLLLGCSSQSPAAIREFELVHFEATGDENSLRYEIEVTELGVVPEVTRSYTFDCVRHPDGSSVLTITDGDGAPVATATRANDGSVTLETASGLELASATGPIAITPAHQDALSLMEWALLDATIFSEYEMPTDLPEDLEPWRDGLVLVDSLDAVEEVTYATSVSPLWHETPTMYSFFQGAVTARITLICIPS